MSETGGKEPASGARLPAWAPPDAGKAFAAREVPGQERRPASHFTKASAARHLQPEELAERLLRGDRSALARAITLVESNAPRHRPMARLILERAVTAGRQSRRVGISGVPGVGKSTFIEAFGNFLCDQGARVAVLAVDPSSSLSGGSILGDKTRMETLARREEAFIRPSPSGGALGGVARKTRETLLLCEAAGFDTILVETVGVGQSEIEVRSMVDCLLLLMLAGAGDELQGIKKGIVEIADILAVNKADGENLLRARAARAELERALGFLSPATEGWRPPVLLISALERTGLKDLQEAIGRFFAHLEGGAGIQRRREQAVAWWRALVEQELRTRFFQEPKVAALARSLEKQVAEGSLPPSLAAERLLASIPGL